MPTARFDPPLHHLFHRAEHGHALFRSPRGMALFEAQLAEACHAHAVKLFAYCLMPTHWHLIVELPVDRWSSGFFRRLGRTGDRRPDGAIGRRSIFEARGFYRACRYVERNPVASRLAAQPSAWRYGSAWMRSHGPPGLASRMLAPWPEGVPEGWDDRRAPGHGPS